MIATNLPPPQPASGRPAVDDALRQLSARVHDALERVDPARFRAAQSDKVRGQLRALRAGALEVRARFASEPEVAALAEQTCDAVALADAAADPAHADWPAVRARLTTAYDALSQALRRRAMAAPRNRPTNYLRNAYHIGNAVVILAYIHLVVGRPGMIATAGIATAFAWSAELSRRRWPAINRGLMRLWGGVAHPDEHWTINSATWMATALLLLALLTPLHVCAVGVAVVGLGDPAAALVGRRWGRRRLRGSKTVAGTVAFVIAGAAAAAAALALWHPALSGGAIALHAGLGAALGAVAELAAGTTMVRGRRWHLDDNFAVPLAAGVGSLLAAAILG